MKLAQERLQELGYDPGVADGAYGAGTAAAVEMFQAVNGLDADGIAGYQTLTALFAETALPRPEPVDVLAPEIPMLVNQWNALPAGFEPANLVVVEDVAGSLMTYERDGMQAVLEAAEALAEMIRAAQAAGLSDWKLRESYRTIADQRSIFNTRVRRYMKGDSHLSRSQAIARTRQTVADPGCSEHHLGLAFDLNVPGVTFGDTAQYRWLKENCWNYGFVIRYTDDKQSITGITGEEWHVRYVGVAHALRMRERNECLEEYVAYLTQP